MISLDEIERTILELESRRDTTFATCEKLATLYVVRDHLEPSEKPISEEASVVSSGGNTEFMAACDGLPTEEVLKVVNELMDAVQMVNPKAYRSVIDKLKSLR